ncbi:unnamed protein product [Linum tenue]|uniref:Transmembrane protein n=1 Tax=Linum tenue TaxID=586396 RepID=A0AAV0PSQ6_9ROSI|nr:unnamed protein product [Linum tenue]
MKIRAVVMAAWLLLLMFCWVSAVDLNLSNPFPQLAAGQDHDLNVTESEWPQRCGVVCSSSKASGSGGKKGGKGGASDIAHRAPPGAHKSYSASLSSPYFYSLPIFSIALALCLVFDLSIWSR